MNDWKSQLIIVRPISNGVVKIVNEPASLKDSRYWLNYIAEPYDALHLTPINPKYKGNGVPTYSCHLVSRAKTDYNEESWNKKVFEDGEKKEITFMPFSADINTTKAEPLSTISETEIIQIADGNPKNLTLAQLRAILSLRKNNLNIILSEPTKWIDWESAMTLMTKDVHVVGISQDSEWPLSITLDPKSGKSETMNYDKDMKFVIRT